MQSWAFIDIGSNSVVCVAVTLSQNDATVHYDRSIITALGRGLSPEGLHKESKARTTEAISQHLRNIRALGLKPTVCAMATSAMRDAKDGKRYGEELAKQFDMQVQIIAGEREARLTYLAASQSFPHLRRVLTIDIGGGSTEYVSGKEGAVSERQSLNIGAVRLTEAHLRGDPPSPESIQELKLAINRALKGLSVHSHGATAVGSGSTISTVLTLRDAIEPYDPKRVHGANISLHDVHTVINLLKPMSIEERGQLPGLAPKRAHVILAGLLILEQSLKHYGVETLIVSDRGMRFGLLYDTLGPVNIVAS